MLKIFVCIEIIKVMNEYLIFDMFSIWYFNKKLLFFNNLLDKFLYILCEQTSCYIEESSPPTCEILIESESLLMIETFSRDLLIRNTHTEQKNNIIGNP